MSKRTRSLCTAAVAAGFVWMMTAAAWASLSGPGTYVEPLSGSIGTWDRLDWVPGSLTDEADIDGDTYGWPDSVTFASGGGATRHIQAFEAYERTAVHLEVDNVPTDAGVRVDSSFFQGAYGSGLEHWGMGVGVYFDADNQVSIKRIRGAGGGLMVYKTEGGSASATQVFTGYHFDGSWAMHGLELTQTQIKFYSSQPGAGPVGGAPSTYDSLDFDGLMTLDLSAFTMTRPASFTGNATILVGKGYNQVGGDPWDVMSDLLSPKTVSIDSTRITVVPEPASLALMLGGLVAFVARRRRG